MNDNKRRIWEPDAPVPAPAKPVGGVAPVVQKPGGRHSAITDALRSLRSYKVWAEKMKRNFEDEGSEKPQGQGDTG